MALRYGLDPKKNLYRSKRSKTAKRILNTPTAQPKKVNRKPPKPQLPKLPKIV